MRSFDHWLNISLIICVLVKCLHFYYFHWSQNALQHDSDFNNVFNKHFSEAISTRRRAGGTKNTYFWSRYSIFPHISFAKTLEAFCTTSNGECCTVINLGSSHRMRLVSCSRWSARSALCVWAFLEGGRQSRSDSTLSFFFLFPLFFQWFLFPLMDTSPLQATATTAVCLQTYPRSLSKAMWHISRPMVHFRRKLFFNFLLVNSEF